MAPDHIMTLKRLEDTMAVGFPWEERCAALREFIVWHLSANCPSGKIHTNGEMTTALLRAVGVRAPNSHYLRRPISKFLTEAGRADEVLKDWVIPGPEMKTHVMGKGMVHVRTRLWKAWGEPEAEVPKTPQDVKDMVGALTQLGYKVIAPGQEAVDTETYSKYPVAGQAALTCGACGGGGRVWKKA